MTRNVSRLRLALVTMTLLTLRQLKAQSGDGTGSVAPRGEPPGSDVFVTAREAVLRERPSRESRFAGTLPGGSRLRLLESGDQYLKVEVVAGTPPAESPSKSPRKPAASTGFLSRDVVSVFPPDDSATNDLLAAGRALAPSEGHRRLAAAFLLRASERSREHGVDSAELEVLLGETAETLAAAGGPFPPGLEVAARPDSRPGVARWLYAGDAFRRAIELTSKSEEGKGAVWRERAIAGRLRQQYPASETPSVAELSKETEAWIEVAGTARDAGVLQVSADRVGAASLSLARLLLALDRRDDLAALESRLTETAGRIASGAPDHRTSAKLLSRVRILHAMRGDGSSPFPQEARARVGPKEVIVRIAGKANALELTVETSVGGTRVPARKRTAVPVLPVPGTLRLAPDGRTAAWVEVAGPSKLVAVVASLESDVPAREIAPSSSGQPPRDGGPAHVLSNLSGYSKDGQRLGVSIETWTDTPGPEARYSVVSVATGEPMFETSKDLKSFRRLIQ